MDLITCQCINLSPWRNVQINSITYHFPLSFLLHHQTDGPFQCLHSTDPYFYTHVKFSCWFNPGINLNPVNMKSDYMTATHLMFIRYSMFFIQLFQNFNINLRHVWSNKSHPAQLIDQTIELLICRHINWYGGIFRTWIAGLILGLRPANERRRYKVTPSLIGWVQT